MHMSLSPTGYKLFAGVDTSLGWWLKLIQVRGPSLRKKNLKLTFANTTKMYKYNMLQGSLPGLWKRPAQ